MALVTGKTVYILGAGASYHTGAPLLSDFLARARSLMNSRIELRWRSSFQNFFNWLDKIRAPAYYLEIDLDNLEHIFSLISMMQELEQPEADNLYRDISYVIFETLEQECQIIRDKSGHYWPDEIYNQFWKKLKALDERRRRRIRTEDLATSKDVIISLNYDIMLDYVLYHDGYFPRSADYCLESTKETSKWRLLKLHGSMNWGIHWDCPKKGHYLISPPQIVNVTPIAPGYMPLPLIREESIRVPFEMVTHILFETKCNLCEQKGVLTPLFIPPTWTKSPKKQQIHKVWAQTVEELKTAFQIVIIGYSLPPTDTFLPYLLTLGLSQNSGLYRIIVINPDRTGEVKQRYEKVFSRGLIGRDQLNFESDTFEIFVKSSKMEIIVENME